jgi:hypothetical protein
VATVSGATFVCDNATGRKRNQNGAHYLQSTSKRAPPARVYLRQASQAATLSEASAETGPQGSLPKFGFNIGKRRKVHSLIWFCLKFVIATRVRPKTASNARMSQIVKSIVLSRCSPLPVFPNKQTFSVSSGMSQRGQIADVRHSLPFRLRPRRSSFPRMPTPMSRRAAPRARAARIAPWPQFHCGRGACRALVSIQCIRRNACWGSDSAASG